VTSAFIIQVQPQLQPDTGEETTALLRVLIHKIDNTTFGNNAPTIPQWSGPPRAITQVQAILYASLAAALLSAFLAMLGKQWLNKYASTDMRGSAVERSQNRQQKLDGIVAWYFDHVMESLPLMLQVALLLLGCALSLYLREIDTTIALVVLGVTSFGIAFYIFIVIAGTASVSCPYQTPGAHILRHILPLVLSAFRSACSNSRFIFTLLEIFKERKCLAFFMFPLLGLILLAVDAYTLARAIIRAFVVVVRRVYNWFRGTCGSHLQTTALDLRCITWMLHTSLDKAIHLLILELLASMTTLDESSPALVSACFAVLAGCVSIVRHKAVIAPGSEEVGVTSTLYCLRELSHPTTMDPASSIFKDMQRRYTRIFPINANLEALPSYHRFYIIHSIFYPSRKLSQLQESYLHRSKIQWENYKLSSNEHTILTKFAWSEYQRKKHQKVPRWILRYTHYQLSQDPLPPAQVVIDCLLIIAMGLRCIVPHTMTLDGRYVHIQ